MRVVCISSWFPDYTIQLANSLSREAKVLLILPNNIAEENVSFIEPEVDVYLFSQPEIYSIAILPFIFHLVKTINNFRPDIIHFQNGPLQLCLVFLMLKRKILVTTIHDSRLHKGEERLLSRISHYIFIRWSSQLITHGTKQRDILIDEYNIPPEKVNSIPLGEHNVKQFKIFENINLKEELNSILFFGRISRYKGIEYLIEAEPLITKEFPNVKIIIAGEGGDFKKYECLMKHKQNFVVHNHYISYKEGAELLKRASIIILPYIDASQSGVIITAYGFKKAVIASDVGSISEILDDGKTGLLIPPKNAEALAKATITLLKNDSLRKSLGQNGYLKLKSELSWDKIVAEIIKVYKKIEG